MTKMLFPSGKVSCVTVPMQHLVLPQRRDLTLVDTSLHSSSERVTELETLVQDLETQLSEQEEEATTAIGVWQQSYTTLEKTNEELSEEIEATKGELQKLKEQDIPTLQRQLEDSQAALGAATEQTLNKDKVTMQLKGAESNIC